MDPRLFRSLEWRCIGPHRGGRVVAVAGHPTETGTFYFGASAGGVWKTTNAGSHWWNISDGFFNTAAVGALAVSDSDPNVIYAGTGEACIRSNVSHGDGVYRSDDGGRTWRNVGLAPTRHISGLAIHPTNPDVVYVAALGRAWGTNPERGIYRSRDGGQTWDLVLHKSDRAGAAALSMDIKNPRVLYAAIWQGRRYPYAAHSGGEDSGLYRSLDGGDTWTDLSRNKGFPKGPKMLGRMGVAASPAQPGRVWALVEEAEQGGVYRSDDYGETWDKLDDNPDLRRRPWYYMHVFADPSNANVAWILNLGLWRSLDGGAKFEQLPEPHGDNHGLWIDPRNSRRMIEGNDGGGTVSLDGGHSWSTLLNQPTAQFYHVTTDDQVPYHVYGPQQDNYAMRLPSVDFEGAISWKDYVEPGGGESGYIAISKKEPNLVFGGGIGTGLGHGRLVAWNPRTGQKRNVTVWPEVLGMGAGAESLKYRFQWTFPVESSPHDDDTLYACSNYVHRSTDDGTTWEVISPDLTRNDPSKLVSSGGPITADNSGAEIYCTIFAFRESPHERGVFWVGSDDGLIHISRDAGQNWTNVTPRDLPEWAMISIIEPSPHDAASAYVAATCYKSDDTRPFLYRTDDYGQTWTRITSGIPDDEFTRVIREDPSRRGLLYCGTERGIHVSFDDGVNWHRLETNLPITPVWDLVVKGTDLVAATHGRSFWILDDITPLHQLKDAGAPTHSAHLFAPRDTVRLRAAGRFDKGLKGRVNYMMTGPVTVSFMPMESASGAKSRAFLDAGANPPDGVVVHYWLSEKPADGVTLAFLDESGAEIRSFTTRKEKQPTESEPPSEGETQQASGVEEVPSSEEADEGQAPWAPAEAGMNRFVWDFSYEKPPKLLKRKRVRAREEELEANVAPKALPGSYQVRLTVGGDSFSQSFRVLVDPRLGVSPQDLKEQFDLKKAIHDRVTEVHQALNQIQRVREQVEHWEERLAKHDDAERIKHSGTVLKDRLAAVERELMNVDIDKPRPGPNRLKERFQALSSMIDESEHPPTRGAREVYEVLRGQLEEQRRRLTEVLAQPLSDFNATVSGLDVQPVSS
jgi:photosystem II stability/assembly factor-like uncharacterized protein